MVIAIPALWAMLFYMTYILVGMIVTMIIPVLIMLILEKIAPIPGIDIILIILCVFFSQVVWRFCSGILYGKLLNFFSFHHISLE